MLRNSTTVAINQNHLELINAMTDEVVILASDGTIMAANTAWKLFCEENDGDALTHYIGTNYFSICEAAVRDAVVQAESVLEGLKSALTTGRAFEAEYPCDGPDVRRWFQLNVNRLMVGDEVMLLIQHRNVTTRRMAHEDIEKAHVEAETYAALVATTGEAILTYDLEGRIISWNPAAERLYGYTAEEAIGQSVELLYPEDWDTSILTYRDRIMDGTLRQFEARRVAKDGTERHVVIACTPIRTMSGDIVSISNIHHDVTEIRQAEKTRELVAREVIHRAKNMLALVSAMQRQTAANATTLEAFNATFGARIQALARSTDVLLDGGWSSAELGQLVTSQFAPFVEDAADLVSSEGPRVALAAQALQVIGMALHELATNSTKYGVLSNGRGHICCDWTVVESGDLRFRWTETGITFSEKTNKKGFGSRVLSDLAPSMLGGNAQLETGADYLRWSVTVPGEYYEKRT